MESSRRNTPSASRNTFSCDLNNIEFLLPHLPNIFVKDLKKKNQEIRRSKRIKKFLFPLNTKIPNLNIRIKDMLDDRKIRGSKLKHIGNIAGHS